MQNLIVEMFKHNANGSLPRVRPQFMSYVRHSLFPLLRVVWIDSVMDFSQKATIERYRVALFNLIAINGISVSQSVQVRLKSLVLSQRVEDLASPVDFVNKNSSPQQS